jgi:hypothetical protein
MHAKTPPTKSKMGVLTMSAPASMSKFLSQPAEGFLAQKSPELAERLSGVFARVGITHVGSLVVKTAETLLESGCTQDDLTQIQQHLGYFDIRLAPGKVNFPGCNL